MHREKVNWCNCILAADFSENVYADEISGEIFDLLLSLGEFTEFKEMMLSYKRARSEAKGVGGISISGHNLTGIGMQEKQGGMSP